MGAFMKIDVIVLCTNSEGEPELFRANVDVTQDQYDDGDHYDIAGSHAEDMGYEVIGAFDEKDRAYKQLTGATPISGDEPTVRSVAVIPAPESNQREISQYHLAIAKKIADSLDFLRFGQVVECDPTYIDFSADISYEDEIARSQGSFSEVRITILDDARNEGIKDQTDRIAWYFVVGRNDEHTGFCEALISAEDASKLSAMLIKFKEVLEGVIGHEVNLTMEDQIKTGVMDRINAALINASGGAWSPDGFTDGIINGGEQPANNSFKPKMR